MLNLDALFRKGRNRIIIERILKNRRVKIMDAYFKKEKSIPESLGVKEIIKRISQRYIDENPVIPYSYRAFSEKGFMRDSDTRCIIDFDNKFKDANMGDYAYALSKIISNSDRNTYLYINIKCPTEIYLNGKKVAETYYLEDECMNEGRIIEISLVKGDNVVFVKCRKNKLGFGCVIGSAYPKDYQINFYTAFDENAGELGWNYSYAPEDIYVNVPNVKTINFQEWLPSVEKNGLSQVYYGHSTMYAVSVLESQDQKVQMTLNGTEKVELFIDGSLQKNNDGIYNLNLEKGTHNISLKFTELSKSPQISVEIKGATLKLPSNIYGVKGNWLYLDSPDEKGVYGFNPYELYDSFREGEKEFFRCGRYSYIRPVLEEKFFGKMSYPLGVVLYGLLRAGDLLDDKEILNYANAHLEQVYASYRYTMWDTQKFGYACINHFLPSLTALDDCGSFSSAVLENYLHFNNDERVLPYADFVGDYILNKQERLEDGMFYRDGNKQDRLDTIWADDLYMGTPFMIRYASIKHDAKILDDVVNQFLCFKKRLFMEDKNLMSHVYNLFYDMPTEVPWGRGNGWVLFSLSELLQVLPKGHALYSEIETFFKSLAKGFLERIDEFGMLHQVLWDEESYAETSCTSMCAVAFFRGVRMGILPEEPYKSAALKCVNALRKYCVDSEGNIYGVCRGSGYSYREEYYKYELPWIFNDAHGTGIVLMAFTESRLV